MKVYCIALEGEGTTGSLWFYKREDRETEKGNTAAEREEYFTLEVPDNATHAEITALVDAAEWEGDYTKEPA